MARPCRRSTAAVNASASRAAVRSAREWRTSPRATTVLGRRAPAGFEVADVSLDEVEAVGDRGQVLAPSGREVAENADAGPSFEQGVDQMRLDDGAV
jgi:hypothetical protein